MQKKKEILLAASNLFGEKGDRFTLEELGKAVNINKASIYSHFQNKEEIILLVTAMQCKHYEEYMNHVFLLLEDEGEAGTVEKDKLRKTDVKYFLIPFIILFTGFAFLPYVTAKNRIEERYDIFETTTLNIADSYAYGLTNSREAYNIITELLDEKIMVASQAIMLIEDREDHERLYEIAQKLEVDEIYLHNNEGKVTYSTTEEYIGWKAYEGHSVYDFLGSFEISKLINDISNRGDVKHVFFINGEYEITASSLSEYIGYIIESQEIREEMDNNASDIHKMEIDGDEVFRVSVPAVYENKKLGTLAITWPTEEVNREVLGIILNGVMIFLTVSFVVGGLLYYADRPSQQRIPNGIFG